MINIWMPVYNEERHLQRAIDSVLAQTHADFSLLISNNHSTDGSTRIIEQAAARDARIRLFSPPHHMTGLEHSEFISTQVLAAASGKYSIFMGGHDLWDRRLLQVLLERAEAELDCAIVYTDSYEIDDGENIRKRYQGIFQTKEVPRPFVPIQVLLSLSHNLIWGGLWRESIRRAVRGRHPCSAADHLMLAEVALLGPILYQSGSAVFLRAAPGAGDWTAYARKHIPERIRRHPILDFLNQLEWCEHLIELAVAGGEYAQEPLKSMLRNALCSSYILRYLENLKGHEQGLQTFFAHPVIQNYLRSNQVSSALLSELVKARTRDYPV